MHKGWSVLMEEAARSGNWKYVNFIYLIYYSVILSSSFCENSQPVSTTIPQLTYYFLPDMTSTEDSWQLCTSKIKISGRISLPYQTLFAFLEIIASPPITMGVSVILLALWILLISRARSWCFSTFSSSVVRHCCCYRLSVCKPTSWFTQTPY